MVKPMRKRSVIAFCFLGLIILAALVQCGFAQSFEAIYIDSEGTVRGTDSIQRIGDKYTLIHNVFGNLTVQREDAIVDGAGYILRGWQINRNTSNKQKRNHHKFPSNKPLLCN